MKKMKRLIALFLSIIILVGLVPSAVFAEGESLASGEVVDALVMFSDLHSSKNDYKQSAIEGVMTAVSGLPISSVTSCGDAFSVNEDSGKYDGSTSTITGYIQSALGKAVPVNYVWSDHDRYALDANGSYLDSQSGFIYGAGADGTYGTADDGNYYIYELSMADLSTNDRYYTGKISDSKDISGTVASFKAVAATLDQTKPLLIASHQPLLDNRNDNGHALIWANAINEVAASMDVAFFFGHNHKYDNAGDYYYAKGSTMSVCSDKNGGSTNVELNFTHLCAGYLEPTSTGSYSSSGTRRNVVMAVSIYEDALKFTTYDKNGVYTGSYAVNETVAREFAGDGTGVPKGYTLDSIAIANVTKTDYFVGQSVDLQSFTVNAIYVKEGAENYIRTLTAEDGYTASCSDMTTPGAQTVTVGFEGRATTFPITVWSKVLSDSATNVQADVSGAAPGVTAMTVEMREDAVITQAVADVLKGNLAAYDIKLTGFTTGTVRVTLPIPADVTNPAVYYVSDDGKIVEPKAVVAKTETTVTFETDHFSTYVVGDSTNVVVPDPETPSGSDTTTTTIKKTYYVLTNSISAGTSYLIASGNTAGNDRHLLTNNNGSVGDTPVAVKSDNIDGNAGNEIYIELDDASKVLWEAGSGYTFQNGGQYLGYTTSGMGNNRRSTFGLSGNARQWSYSSSRLSTSAPNGRNNTTYYLRYSGGWGWATQNNNVYFYVPTEVEVETTATVSGTYSIVAEDVLAVVKEAGQTKKLDAKLAFTPNVGEVKETDISTTATYAIVEGGDPNDIIESINNNGVVTFTGNHGKALVKVSYETSFGTATNYITVEASAPYYTLDLHQKKTDADGKPVAGAEITDIITLKGVKANDTYSVWAVIKEFDGVIEDGEDGKDLGDVEDNRIRWEISEPDIAEIDIATGVITFTGDKYGAIRVSAYYLDAEGNILCADEIDISVSETSATIPSDGTNDFPEYPNEGAVRHDKTATGVGNFSQTGVAKIELSMTGVPYTTGNEMDVVLMLDRSSSMYKSGVQHRISSTVEATKVFVESIVKNEDGSFNNNRILVMDFLGGNIDSSQGGGSSHQYQCNTYTTNESNGYQIISNQAELDALLNNIQTKFTGQTSLYGTEYAQGLEDCYNALLNSQADGRKQFCVFMSDGIPNYLMGETTHFKTTGAIVGRFTGTPNSNTPNMSRANNYEYEYYSTEMKKMGVTVFTVGLGLKNTNSAWSSASKEACEQVANMLLNDISGPAYEAEADRDTGAAVSKLDEYFFTVEDDGAAAQMKNVFANIAQKILAAATDVTVGDKMGDHYVMVFDAPNETVDAADGDQEYYIEVSDYTLVPMKDGNGTITDYQRGEKKSLLKLYFGYDESTGYFAATDNKGTKAATPVFAQVTLGDKGTKYYWSTDPNQCTHDVSVVGADGDTYYFVETGDGTHNMISGAYASGTKTPFNGVDDDGNKVVSYTTHDMIIATPYFIYNGDDDEKMLVWTLEELSANEMTLSYFLFLEDSGGFSGTEHAKDPGAYNTNQFAYVDYKNFQGTDCRLEFPVPQMVWNGAQVSYVFYLVNEDGQPVNRAGRVVPFSEAVYITDVHTEHIVWNGLEQAVGLEAVRKAKDLLPDVYDLYDPTAEYKVHVYEDRDGVHFSNHFGIFGSKDVNTTYVFNTKADADKYTEPGVYVAKDADTLWCKSYDVVNGTFETKQWYHEEYGIYYTYVVTGATYTGSLPQVPAGDRTWNGGTVLDDGYVYFVDAEGKVYTIVQEPIDKRTEPGFDFANTTVAFAVVWKPRLATDTVVVDYGLDVLIDVSKNDTLDAGVVGLRTEAPDVLINEGTYKRNESNTQTDIDLLIDADGNGSQELQVATAKIENLNTIRFSLDKTNGMQFKEPVEFYYEVDAEYYDGAVKKTDSMYSSVTVIPATTIYYEDSMIARENLKSYEWAGTGWGETTTGVGTGTFDWQKDGREKSATQDQDRPGVSQLSAAPDADNHYGYDSAYDNMSTHSLGSALKVHVDYDHMATAEFSFYGTGFDVISTTSNTTGTIIVNVYDAGGSRVRSNLVNTYFGMTYDGENWTPTTSADPNALYQVPVMEIAGLPYGKYTAEIEVMYDPIFDQGLYADASYDFYLDAIRIYDPTGNLNDTANKAYIADGEAWPVYEELRNLVIDAAALETGGVISGYVFIDGISETDSVSDYTSYGPNNEVYLANGQAIIFSLADHENLVDVQLGIKSAVGNANYTISNAVIVNDQVGMLDVLSGKLTSTTDRYFSLLTRDANGNPTNEDMVFVIENTGGGILSLTNLKYTFTAETELTGTLMQVEKDIIEKILTNRQESDEMETPEVEQPEIEKDLITGATVPASVLANRQVAITVTTTADVKSVTVDGVAAKSKDTADGKEWTAYIITGETGQATLHLTE